MGDLLTAISILGILGLASTFFFTRPASKPIKPKEMKHPTKGIPAGKLGGTNPLTEMQTNALTDYILGVPGSAERLALICPEAIVQAGQQPRRNQIV